MVNLNHDICPDYDWGKVEQLVSPHLDNFLMTALVMQGQSANYHTAEAASQAIADVKDEQVRAILARIIASDCD
ncbi:hypothetical protein [Thalassomonas sp. RHCl1]|uniref:hypothetical protein n=1 Tax=Thalassomonas sp. RHCl1 TaxID=2995320 RepID=UPI00248AAE23|nr:hypothetical protein [Thalassomonas sp. RHCl1]